MKAAPLLISLPLMLSRLAAQSLPPDASGNPTTSAATRDSTRPPLLDAANPATTTTTDSSAYTSPITGELRTLRIRGHRRTVEIMTDRFHVRHANGKQSVVELGGSRSMDELMEAIASAEASTGDRCDVVAYIPERAKTDRTKMLITRRVTVQLAEGVSPNVFAATSPSGAIKGERFSFIPDGVILTYRTTEEAMAASEQLRTVPGVIDAGIMIAKQHVPEYIPPTQYFLGGGPPYQITPQTDNVFGAVCPPDLCGILGTSAYQWWANNIPEVPPGRPRNSTILKVALGDNPPIGYDSRLPATHGEMADIRLPTAWEVKGDFDKPVSGNLKKVLLIDDGIQKTPTHNDLFGALDIQTSRHVNYFYAPGHSLRNSPDPIDAATDTHGTVMAGIVGARNRPTGSRITGVAPGCIFQSAVALKGFVDDADWAWAFAQGTTLEDTQHNNIKEDDTRSGQIFFDICLNATAETGAQDGTDVFPEDWLWRRAIRFGSYNGRQQNGAIYVTSAGNGGDGHMNTNYSEQKNSIFQIPVAGVSDLGRRIAYSNLGANIVCAAPTRGDELPPLMAWAGAPPGWPANLPINVNPSVDVEDLPYLWRRNTQAIPSITTGGGVEFNHEGTSASAAMVAGIVALMLEVSPNLSARDVKEILMRASRVCSDVRIDYNGNIFPTQWRMTNMGHPIHNAFGAGIIDANKAVQIAKLWPKLAVDPLRGRQDNKLSTGDPAPISKQNTETGGIYFSVTTQQLIPTNGTPIDIVVPPPPSGMRVEHIEVRVRTYHKRRGDLDITLLAPPDVGWDRGILAKMEWPQPLISPVNLGWEDGIRGLESKLFPAHREDYNEDRYSSLNPDLNDPLDWTFTTIRHWGTRLTTSSSTIPWKVRVRDASNAGTNPNPTLGDPVFVPSSKPNPTDVTSQRMAGIAMTYHGVYTVSKGNEPPTVIGGKYSLTPGSTVKIIQLQKGEGGKDAEGNELFPVTSWDFYNPVDICPRQPTNPPREYFEYFPPLLRDPLDPTRLIPLDDPTTIIDEWPNQPAGPTWVPFILPPAPVSGPLGGLTEQPAWRTTFNNSGIITARRTLEMTPDNQFMVLHEKDKKGNETTNIAHMRLNRRLGQLEFVPHNSGRYKMFVYNENYLGLSSPIEVEVLVFDHNYLSWRDVQWDAPEVTDESISGWYADPDNDGLQNGLEYLMNRDPLTADPGPVPDFRVEGTEMVFTYSVNSLLTDGYLHPQVYDDQEVWTDVPFTVLTTTNGVQDIEVRLPIDQTKKFFRLWAEKR